VLTVNKDEIQLAIFDTACGFHRRQPNRMPATRVHAKSTQGNRYAPVKRLCIVDLLDVLGARQISI
jgi:hypothetical protein